LLPSRPNPAFREKVVDIQRTREQVIDDGSKDAVIDSGYSRDATDRATLSLGAALGDDPTPRAPREDAGGPR